MEEIHRIEIIINIFLQSLGGWLVLPMQLVSALGAEEFYMLVLPVLYWCVNASLGIRVGFMLILTSSVNAWLKLLFALPRPFWADASVKALVSETSFGLPSGHAMNSTSLWGFFASQVKKRWVTIAVVVVVFLIGFSRLVLGIHYLTDVLAGWLFGGVLLFIFLKLERPVTAWIKRLGLGGQITLAILSSLALIAITYLFIALDSPWNPLAVWIANAPNLVPLDLSGMVSLAGTWLGLATSLAWMYRRNGFIKPGKSLRMNAIRYILGAAGVAVILFGLGAIFPRSLDFIALTLRYARYALVGAWVGAFAPLLFERLKV